MPYVNLQVTRGVTREQKEEIVRSFTETLVRVLGKQLAALAHRLADARGAGADGEDVEAARPDLGAEADRVVRPRLVELQLLDGATAIDLTRHVAKSVALSTTGPTITEFGVEYYATAAATAGGVLSDVIYEATYE